jgi:hypothetical protein
VRAPRREGRARASSAARRTRSVLVLIQRHSGVWGYTTHNTQHRSEVVVVVAVMVGSLVLEVLGSPGPGPRPWSCACAGEARGQSRAKRRAASCGLQQEGLGLQTRGLASELPLPQMGQLLPAPTPPAKQIDVHLGQGSHVLVQQEG